MTKCIHRNTACTIEIARAVFTFQPATITAHKRNFGASVGFHNGSVFGVICHRSFVISSKLYIKDAQLAIMGRRIMNTPKMSPKANHPRNMIEGG